MSAFEQIGHRRAAGFTLVELMISMLVFGIIIAGALGFMTNQNKAFNQGIDRMKALTNLHFAIQTLETDVSTLGTNLVPGQPGLVYAGSDVIAFNADYATNASNDPFAVYYDPDVPAGEVTSPPTALTIPGTAFTWPDTAFTTILGTPAPAELIVFRFDEDTETSRTDDYMLRRKVNGAAWQTVARNLIEPSNGDPFFRYLIHRAYPSAATELDSIADTDLPKDSDGYLADSVRAVRVSLQATNGLSGDNERIAEMTRVITMPNAGLRKLGTCGDEPLLGTGVIAVPGVDVQGDPIVTLTWGNATDDGGGENDVMRYVLWRRDVGAGGTFGDPLVSVPAGTGNTYVDSGVDSGITYQYRLAAQDCTPSLSSTASSVNVTIP